MDYKANMEAKGDEEDLDTPIKPYFDRSIDPAEPAEIEKQTANLAKGAESLNDIANSDDNIEVYNNQADIAELNNYMQFMKNSDMEVGKKNRSILVAIMKYLANNMTNDAAANSVSEIELSDPAQEATALKLAKKYLQGKIEIKQPKAKKDLYGKDKTEGVTFESYAQRMDMIAEGTWQLPINQEEANKIAAMMANPIALGDGGDDAINAIATLLGDDELWDDLGVAGDKDPEGDARGIIIGWMMEHVDDYGDPFTKSLQAALDKIRADGNDSGITIPRTFGNPRFPANTSATQGERMGSNADEVKANEDEAELDEGKMSDISQEIDDVAAQMEQNDMLAPFVDDFVTMAQKTYNIKDALEAVLPDYVPGNMIQDLVGEGVNEGKMKDLMMHIEEMIQDGATNEEIKKMHPMVSDSNIDSIRREMDESVQFEEVQEVDEVAESIAKMKAMAGVGSKFKSNHGIHEGEEGYQLTPRSIVAREMRKLQDIERGSK
jgi:hypothetical protein